MRHTIIANEYIPTEVAKRGILKLCVFLLFQTRIYVDAVKRMVSKPGLIAQSVTYERVSNEN